MKKKSIDKIIKIKGNFEIRFKPKLCTGWGNISFATPVIKIWKDVWNDEIYHINLYNISEYGNCYAPHGDYTYKVSNGVCRTDDEDFIYRKKEHGYDLLLPYYWEDEQSDIIDKLIDILMK